MRKWFLFALLGVFIGLGCKKHSNKPATKNTDKETKESSKKSSSKTIRGKVNKKVSDKDRFKLVAFKPLSGVIAVVNGEEVKADRFNKKMLRLTQGGTRKLPQERLIQVEKSVLRSIVDEALIEQAAKKAGITVTKEDIQKELNDFKSRFPSPQRFEEFLKRARMTMDDVTNWLKSKIMLEKLLKKQGALKVTQEDAQKVYKNNIQFYTEPERIHLLKLFVAAPKNNSKEDNKKLQEKLKAIEEAIAKGTDFKTLVAKYSNDIRTKGKGGDMGWVRKGLLPENIEKVVFSMKKGAVTKKPFKTEKGYYFFKVVDKKAKIVHSFDEVKNKILDSLRHRKVFLERMKLVKQLREKAKIQIKVKFDKEEQK